MSQSDVYPLVWEFGALCAIVWDREAVGADTLARKRWCSPACVMERHSRFYHMAVFEVFLEDFPNPSEKAGVPES